MITVTICGKHKGSYQIKNQYVGDYGKYGLLRFPAKNGIKIGINWYLTENDDSSNGKFTNYLNKPAEGNQ